MTKESTRCSQVRRKRASRAETVHSCLTIAEHIQRQSYWKTHSLGQHGLKLPLSPHTSFLSRQAAFCCCATARLSVLTWCRWYLTWHMWQNVSPSKNDFTWSIHGRKRLSEIPNKKSSWMNVQNYECSSEVNPAHISQFFLQTGPDSYRYAENINESESFQDRFVRFPISSLTENAPLQH